MNLVQTTVILVSCCALVMLIGLAAALAMVATSPLMNRVPKDVFGFASLQTNPQSAPPSLTRYAARDGEQLAYRFYDSTSDQILIFVHGSSYHGASYHALASMISSSGVSKVVLPNLRGHFQSGRRRGDVDYVGQLEDDIADLVQCLRKRNLQGPVILGGHSSGGGFVIRFSGGVYAHLISRFLMLSPIIPASPAIRSGSSGGWANLHMRRLLGLLTLNSVGIRGFNGLSVIEFNKPVEFWDGSETLSYSYRLNVSYHPRLRYRRDLRRLDEGAMVVIGQNDQAIDAHVLQQMFAKESSAVRFSILPGIDHFGIFTSVVAHRAIADWLAEPTTGFFNVDEEGGRLGGEPRADPTR